MYDSFGAATITLKQAHNTVMFSLCTAAVPAPSDLRFSEVSSDSIEVSWSSPNVPNVADVNKYLVRYEQEAWTEAFRTHCQLAWFWKMELWLPAKNNLEY